MDERMVTRDYGGRRDKKAYEELLVLQHIHSYRIKLNMEKEAASHSVGTSVSDPRNFGTDPDPDPWIHTSE